MRAIDCSSCVHFIPVSVHKSFQSSSSTASTVVVDVEVDVDVDVEVDVDEDVDIDVDVDEDVVIDVDVEVDVDEDVDVDVEDVAGTTASTDWRSSTRTGTFCRPPSIRRDKPLLRFSWSHN